MIEVHQLNDYPALHRPRRVLKYVLLWCSAGEATVRVDEHDLVLRPNSVLPITSGQYHCLTRNASVAGLVLEFTFDFFCKDDRDIELVFHNGLFCHFDQHEVIPLPEPQLPAWLLGRMQQELQQQPYQYLTALHALVELLLVEINRAKVAQGAEIWKPEALFLKFLEAVRNSFHQHDSLAMLAQRLRTTELKLNELAKLFTGKSAQLVMHGLVVAEAKRLLNYERASIKEVAFQLGFTDPFYFSNFFKKHTGLSPKGYREQLV